MFMERSAASGSEREERQNEAEDEQDEPRDPHELRVRHRTRAFGLRAENRGNRDQGNREAEHQQPAHGWDYVRMSGVGGAFFEPPPGVAPMVFGGLLPGAGFRIAISAGREFELRRRFPPSDHDHVLACGHR
jgi:hypothetical protein